MEWEGQGGRRRRVGELDSPWNQFPFSEKKKHMHSHLLPLSVTHTHWREYSILQLNMQGPTNLSTRLCRSINKPKQKKSWSKWKQRGTEYFKLEEEGLFRGSVIRKWSDGWKINECNLAGSVTCVLGQERKQKKLRITLPHYIHTHIHTNTTHTHTLQEQYRHIIWIRILRNVFKTYSISGHHEIIWFSCLMSSFVSGMKCLNNLGSSKKVSLFLKHKPMQEDK